HISFLERRFPNVKHDIKIGLRCKWEIAQKHYDDALGLWNKLRDKTKPVHKSLLRDALNGLLGSMKAGDPKAAEVRGRISQLENDLKGVDPRNLDIATDDD